MRITIDQVTPTANCLCVAFSCRCGSGVAQWAGRSIPREDQALDVEFDIALPIKLSTNAVLCEDRQFSISHDGSCVTFVGSIDGQDDDGVVYLRLGTDCLIMAESTDVGLADRWIRLKVPSELVKLTPIGG